MGVEICLHPQLHPGKLGTDVEEVTWDKPGLTVGVHWTFAVVTVWWLRTTGMYSQTVLEAKKMAWWYLLGLTVSKLQERILVAISQPLEAQASWLPNSNLSLCLYMVSPSSPCFSPLLSFVLVQGVCIPGCSRTHDLPTSAEILVLHHGNPLSLLPLVIGSRAHWVIWEEFTFRSLT